MSERFIRFDSFRFDRHTSFVRSNKYFCILFQVQNFDILTHKVEAISHNAQLRVDEIEKGTANMKEKKSDVYLGRSKSILMIYCTSYIGINEPDNEVKYIGSAL